MAANRDGVFRGGQQGDRDRWFGLERREGFPDFKRWWHREGCRELNDRDDIPDRQQAEEFWKRWNDMGRPKAK